MADNEPKNENDMSFLKKTYINIRNSVGSNVNRVLGRDKPIIHYRKPGKEMSYIEKKYKSFSGHLAR